MIGRLDGNEFTIDKAESALFSIVLSEYLISINPKQNVIIWSISVLRLGLGESIEVIAKLRSVIALLKLG